MLITSHLFATLLVSKSLSLGGPETFVALTSGVAIDLDHFFVNKKWIQDVKDFLYERKITRGVNQHSILQEPLFGIIFGVFLGFLISNFIPEIRWWVFPLFLTIHILIDSIMKCEHQPFLPFNKYSYWGFLKSGTRTEFILSILGLVILLT